MGFWAWLTGKKPRATTTDRIWMTRPAKWRGLCRELVQHLSNDKAFILLAHFPATLAEIRQELDRQGVPHQSVDQPISVQGANRFAGPGAERLVRLGLVKQLQPDPFPDPHVEEESLIQILVAERHFLRECDETVVAFAGGLEKRCHVTYHCSLEDPLLKALGGDWIKDVLRRLGMNESTPLESGMVARRMRGAQRKFGSRAGQGCDADSAEEWLRSNGFGESL